MAAPMLSRASMSIMEHMEIRNISIGFLAQLRLASFHDIEFYSKMRDGNAFAWRGQPSRLQ
jgi:hypothetical protein